MKPDNGCGNVLVLGLLPRGAKACSENPVGQLHPKFFQSIPGQFAWSLHNGLQPSDFVDVLLDEFLERTEEIFGLICRTVSSGDAHNFVVMFRNWQRDRPAALGFPIEDGPIPGLPLIQLAITSSGSCCRRLAVVCTGSPATF